MRAVCQAFDLKCHTQLCLAFSSVGVPRLGLQVAHPSEDESWCATPLTPSDTPKCLDFQPLLWKRVLECHALMFKWHAHLKVTHASLAFHAWVFKWHA
ncbi:hypothetical protein AHAS_Ahas15G0194000 [Arachis hypogaea]